MRIFQFFVSEPRDEMIMGICFPAALMLPTSILGAVMYDPFPTIKNRT